MYLLRGLITWKGCLDAFNSFTDKVTDIIPALLFFGGYQEYAPEIFFHLMIVVLLFRDLVKKEIKILLKLFISIRTHQSGWIFHQNKLTIRCRWSSFWRKSPELMETLPQKYSLRKRSNEGNDRGAIHQTTGGFLIVWI